MNYQNIAGKATEVTLLNMPNMKHGVNYTSYNHYKHGTAINKKALINKCCI